MREDDYFDNVFIVEPTHDLSVVAKYGGNFRFITKGSETTDSIDSVVAQGMDGFNPDTDCIIPMGRVMANLSVGMYLGENFQGKVITIGAFRGTWYEFLHRRIELGKA